MSGMCRGKAGPVISPLRNPGYPGEDPRRRHGVPVCENSGAASMTAKIYRPAKTAMQSGKAKTHLWVLEFDAERPKTIDPMMGYTSSRDMNQQVKLMFETSEEAIAYAERKGIEYRVIEPKEATRKRVAYPDNFRFNRMQPWTH
jgi:hypothetical protein